MAPLPAPAEKPSKRVSESQSHAKLSPPAQVAVFCAAPWPNLQPALTPLFRQLNPKHPSEPCGHTPTIAIPALTARLPAVETRAAGLARGVAAPLDRRGLANLPATDQARPRASGITLVERRTSNPIASRAGTRLHSSVGIMRCFATAHDTHEGGPVPPQGPSLRQKNRSPQLFCKRPPIWLETDMAIRVHFTPAQPGWELLEGGRGSGYILRHTIIAWAYTSRRTTARRPSPMTIRGVELISRFHAIKDPTGRCYTVATPLILPKRTPWDVVDLRCYENEKEVIAELETRLEYELEKIKKRDHTREQRREKSVVLTIWRKLIGDAVPP